MMRTNKITIKTVVYPLIFILLAGFSSCKKMLDLKPTDQLNEAEIFTSIEKVESALLGVYQDWYPEYSIRIGSLLADECRIAPQNSGVAAAGQNLFRWTFSSADEEVLAPWKNAYFVIDRANLLLKGLDKVPLKDEHDSEKIRQIKGELLAIRAYEHFDLYRIYGSSGIYRGDSYAVPYMRVPDINGQPSRLPTDGFFAFLKKDLTDAEAILIDQSNIRLGLTATYALHARVALYSGEYSDAVKYAEKVIAKVPLATSTDFPEIWRDKQQSEIIFKLKRTNVSNMRPGDLFYNVGSERILFAPSLKLMESYDQKNDIRYQAWFETDPSLADQGEYPETIVKYSGEDGARNRNDVKVFRSSEMYLIRAEAALKGANLQLAAKDLNTLRASRILNYSPENFSDTGTLFAAIQLERFKELPYEGHRYFDRKRQNLPLERMTSDAVQGDLKLLQTDLYYYIPIPQAEVLANPNIRPNNPGW